jgi:hypothetical protein
MSHRWVTTPEAFADFTTNGPFNRAATRRYHSAHHPINRPRRYENDVADGPPESKEDYQSRVYTWEQGTVLYTAAFQAIIDACPPAVKDNILANPDPNRTVLSLLEELATSYSIPNDEALKELINEVTALAPAGLTVSQLLSRLETHIARLPPNNRAQFVGEYKLEALVNTLQPDEKESIQTLYNTDGRFNCRRNRQFDTPGIIDAITAAIERARSNRTHQVNPFAAAATNPTLPLPAAATFTQQDLTRALNSPYCWIHGHNSTHLSLACLTMARTYGAYGTNTAHDDKYLAFKPCRASDGVEGSTAGGAPSFNASSRDRNFDRNHGRGRGGGASSGRGGHK